MSLPAQPQQTTENPETAAAEPQNSPVAAPTAPVAVPQDPRSYLAIMTLAVFTLSSGLARAYRGDGWTRFWVYVAANVIMIIPILGQIVGGVTLLVLTVLGIVDVFKFRNATTDGTGAPLAMTATDKKWGHGLFVFLMVTIGLAALLLVGLLALAGASFQDFSNRLQQVESSTQTQQYIEPSSL